APAASPPAPDAGLLSPVRAGTPVEDAVSDTAWLRAMLDAEAALARAQARLGTLPESAAAAITAAARGNGVDLVTVARGARETANPVVGLVAALTDAVARLDPAAAEFVHRGSTSQDIFDTAAMLVARRALRLLHADLRRCERSLRRLALAHRDTPMPGRTLTLHAVPTTFGLKAAGWRQLVLDAARRVARLLDEGLPHSLGGAAGTLAGYLATAPAEPDYPARLAAAFADETGLRAPTLPWHSLRTPVADLAAVLSLTAGALGKIAVDVQSLARTEVGEVAEPRGGGAGRGASSAMPHKRNPVLATLIRSAALQVPAYAGVLTGCLLSEDERSGGAWHAEWQPLRECLRLTGGAAHTAVELTEGLVVDPARMRANLRLTGGQIATERLAAALAPRLGKHAAKALLTEAATRADRTGRKLAAILHENPDVAALLTPGRLAQLLDPERYTGAAAELVDAALADHHPGDT
ncbi:3-carboxy-cis,cis-muconate cycloisomerase, partial [Streptomyces alkaliterrae]|nr:3-carboxy-cis,cis-muconate cycloisomerase [Streptomyces alkaliterrae]